MTELTGLRKSLGKSKLVNFGSDTGQHRQLISITIAQNSDIAWCATRNDYTYLDTYNNRYAF